MDIVQKIKCRRDKCLKHHKRLDRDCPATSNGILSSRTERLKWLDCPDCRERYCRNHMRSSAIGNHPDEYELRNNDEIEVWENEMVFFYFKPNICKNCVIVRRRTIPIDEDDD